jgi:hypothetical protein
VDVQMDEIVVLGRHSPAMGISGLHRRKT